LKSNNLLLFFLLILIFILYYTVTLLINLFKCYVSLIFQIIFAPILIATGIFPGSKTDFSSWLKQVVGNILVFPATFLFLVFVNLFLSISDNGELWAPGVISWGNGIGIRIAVGLVSFFIAPQIPVVIPRLINGGKQSPWSQALTQSIQTGQKEIIGRTKSGIQSGIQAQSTYKQFDTSDETAGESKETARKLNIISGLFR